MPRGENKEEGVNKLPGAPDAEEEARGLRVGGTRSLWAVALLVAAGQVDGVDLKVGQVTRRASLKVGGKTRG